MPKLIDPTFRKLAVEAVRQGLSYHAVVAQFAARGVKISVPTVRRWALQADEPAEAPAPSLEAEAEPPLPLPAPDPSPALPPIEVPTSGTAIELTRALIAAALERARRAEATGHFEAAASFQRQATLLMPQLKMLEKGERDAGDRVEYSAAEIKEAEASVRARIAAYLDRPLLCQGCGRALSAKWGHENVADPGQEDHSQNPSKSGGV